MSKINKVLYNVDQRDSDSSKGNTREEMWMARNNIGLDEVIGHATVTENDKEYKGIAPLGTNGLVPAEYLPSFVNAVVNGYYYNGKFYRESTHTTEISPDTDTTYVDITVADIGVGYRWTVASGYFQISSQNAFGALKAGNDTIHADQPMDLLTIAGDSGITVAVADTRGQEQNGTDKLTIGHSNSIVAGRIGENSPATQINNTFNLPWASFDAQGHITATGSNAITIKNASTGEYGVTKLTSTPGTGETLAMTPMGVQNAINTLDASVGSTGGTNVALTVNETDGVITGVRITKDDTAKASHVHGNITSDGKVTKEAASYNHLLITNSSDQVVVGPAFGTGAGDDNLFLNKQGNWSAINEASANAVGGIKIGFTKNATKYPVELSDGKAYVDVPCSEIKVWRGSSTGSIHQNLMTIYEDASTGACASITFNNENSTVNMVKDPSVGDGGKILTVVDPGGSQAPYFSWLPSSSELSLLTIKPIDIQGEKVVSIADGESYDMRCSGSGSPTVILDTASTTTVHSLITVRNASASSCNSVRIRYYTVTGELFTIEISMNETTVMYGFNVDIRKVENAGGGSIAIARVYDMPCVYRYGHTPQYESDTGWIGLFRY